MPWMKIKSSIESFHPRHRRRSLGSWHCHSKIAVLRFVPVQGFVLHALFFTSLSLLLLSWNFFLVLVCRGSSGWMDRSGDSMEKGNNESIILVMEDYPRNIEIQRVTIFDVGVAWFHLLNAFELVRLIDEEDERWNCSPLWVGDWLKNVELIFFKYLMYNGI